MERPVSLFVEHVALSDVLGDDGVQRLVLVLHQLLHKIVELPVLRLKVSKG